MIPVAAKAKNKINPIIRTRNSQNISRTSLEKTGVFEKSKRIEKAYLIYQIVG
jgi:hypothetical protein